MNISDLSEAAAKEILGQFGRSDARYVRSQAAAIIKKHIERLLLESSGESCNFAWRDKWAEEKARADKVEQKRLDGYKIADEMRKAVWEKPGFTFTGKNYAETIGEIKSMVERLGKHESIEAAREAVAEKTRADSMRLALEESSKLLAFLHGAFGSQLKAGDKARLTAAHEKNRAALSVRVAEPTAQPAPSVNEVTPSAQEQNGGAS